MELFEVIYRQTTSIELDQWDVERRALLNLWKLIEQCGFKQRLRPVWRALQSGNVIG
jgi:hypothetical protein